MDVYVCKEYMWLKFHQFKSDIGQAVKIVQSENFSDLANKPIRKFV